MALTNYDRANLSASQQAAVQKATNDWNAANARGDAAGMAAAHAAAEAARNSAGYTSDDTGAYSGAYGSATAAEPMYTIRVNGATTGGISGDERAAQIEQQNKQAQLAVQYQQQLAAQQALYQQQLAAQQAEYERQKREAEELLRQQKAAELEASLSNLANAYQQNMNGYNQQAALLPQTYESARNATAAQNAQAGREFDERALAMGLSSGARGQAQLSRSAAYQNAMTQIDQQQANAQSDIDLAKNNLTTNYNNTVANARAQNEASLSDALYNELVRQEEQQRSDLQRAQQYQLQLAQLAQGVGDYSWLNQLGIDTSAYERQQASLAAQAAAEAAAYKPTFTVAQIQSEIKNAQKAGVTPSANVLRDYEYYYGEPYGGVATLTGGSSGGSGSSAGTRGTTGSVYNNGGLDSATVKQIQSYFGLDADGYWGPNSQSTTGYANAAEAQTAMQALQQQGAQLDNHDVYHQPQSDLGATSSAFQNPLAPGGANPSYRETSNGTMDDVTATVVRGYNALSSTGRAIYAQITGTLLPTTERKQAAVRNAFTTGQITLDEYNFLMNFV